MTESSDRSGLGPDRARGELARYLARRISHQGPLTVAEFMAEALGHPRYGYYAAGPGPIGAAGDFVTAPEVSQMFGELIGLWCADLWMRAGSPHEITILEFGPGNGTLLTDFWRAAAGVPGFHAAAHLRLVESSAALKKDQYWAVGKWNNGPRSLEWFDRLADLDSDKVAGGPLFVIANEFFDAMPIRQFLRLADGWHERLIDCDEKGFRYIVGPGIGPAMELLPSIARAPDVPEGSLAEVSPASLVLAHDIARHLAARGGAALVIDYGYDQARFGPTLQAVLGHRGVDPLASPGTADLTAHVDFQGLGQAFVEGGAHCHGPVAQGAWLRALGVETRAAALKQKASKAQARTIDDDCARLIADQGMGTLFRVLAATGPGYPEPAGFCGAS